MFFFSLPINVYFFSVICAFHAFRFGLYHIAYNNIMSVSIFIFIFIYSISGLLRFLWFVMCLQPHTWREREKKKERNCAMARCYKLITI